MNVEALRPPLRRDFLRLLDYLTEVQTATGRQLLRWWRELGQAAGISEEELRDELLREQRAESNGLVGCSWLKCMRYELEDGEVAFMCAGCRKAMYCGLSCQDR